MKKLFALVLALIMLMSLTAVAFADGDDPGSDPDPAPTTSITVPNNGHSYEAYPIFTGDFVDVGGTKVLTNIQWGTGINAAGKTALFNHFSIADSSLPALVTKLSELENDSDGTRQVAAIVGANLVDGTGLPLTSGAATTVPAGYYLVKDAADSLGTGASGTLANEAYTRFILHVAGQVTLDPKASVPTVDKKQNVTSIDDDTAYTHEGLSQVIGQEVNYELTGTMPDTLADYAKYKYVFHDTLSAGLTYKDGSVKVYIDGTEVEVDGTKLAFTADGSNLTVSFRDIKGDFTVTKDSVVIVKYTATLNANAVIGNPGNPNRVKLEFSNDPNQTGEGEPATSETPEHGVVVFTFKVNVTKVDNDDNTKKLKDAKFRLYKEVNGTKYYAVANATTNTLSWTTTVADATAIVSDNNGQFSIVGLDLGQYYLEEYEAPTGYNLPSAPFSLRIYVVISGNKVSAYIDTNTADGQAPHIQFDGTTIYFDPDHMNGTQQSAGSFNVQITNSKGHSLPSTGGIGTTLFYVIGSVLMLGAAVLLIVKKRMNNM